MVIFFSCQNISMTNSSLIQSGGWERGLEGNCNGLEDKRDKGRASKGD